MIVKLLWYRPLEFVHGWVQVNHDFFVFLPLTRKLKVASKIPGKFFASYFKLYKTFLAVIYTFTYDCPSPGSNVIKIYTDVNYECLEEARVFVLGKPFQPSLMFVGKASGYYRRAKHLKGASLG